MNHDTKCGTPSNGIVSLDLEVADDRAPSDRIGYRLAVVGGQLPVGIRFPEHDVIGYLNTLELVFSASHDGPVAFDLEIRAVDLNGNVGKPTTVHVDGSL